MKKAVIAAALLLLTACSPSSSFVQGEVVSCESISQDPNFTGGISMDCLDRTEGAQLGGLRGPMVVNVWGSWCGPCQEETPLFVDFYSRAKDKVILLGIDVEEAQVADGRHFVETRGITWPNLYDPDGRTASVLGMGVPITYFVDAQGVTVYKKIGVITSVKELEELTRKYLGIKI